jgi:hypothetical protein
MAKIPVALLDNCRPPLRTRAPAVRIVASSAKSFVTTRLALWPRVYLATDVIETAACPKKRILISNSPPP